MPNVTLTNPVVHDGATLEPGDVIRDLSRSAADRLVRLGYATMGTMVHVDPEDDESDTSAALKATVDAMTKAKLAAALKTAGIAVPAKATSAELKAIYLDHLANGSGKSATGGRLSAEEEEELALMNRDELADALEEADENVDADESEDALRARLRAVWIQEAADRA